MERLNEQELNLFDACEDYNCEDTCCSMCDLYKKTGENTGFCAINFILNALYSRAESEG